MTTSNSNNTPAIFNPQQFGQLRIIPGRGTGEPWFVGNEVCDILELVAARNSLSLLDRDERTTVHTMCGHNNFTGLRKDTVLVNEFGLYSLILRSRKPEAKTFKRWITHEVLPAIRKTGGYLMASPDESPDAILARAVLVANDTLERMKRELVSKSLELEEVKPKAALVDSAFARRNSGLVKLSDLARKFARLNVNKIKSDLQRLGYLYRHNYNSPYRVYSKYRDSLFVEKYNDFHGTNDIYATKDGAAMVASLYNDGQLTMKRG